MADKALTDEKLNVIIFKEDKPDTPLYLSDEPYYMARSLSDGVADLERLANSSIEEEGGWMFSHYDNEWYNIRTSSRILDQGKDGGIGMEAIMLGLSPHMVGQKVTMYHIHPCWAIDMYLPDYINGLNNPKLQQYMRMERGLSEEESRIVAELQSAFMVTLPSPADIGACALYDEFAGTSCDFDFKIISPLGITTIEVDRFHNLINEAFSAYIGFCEDQVYPPWEIGESIRDILYKYPDDPDRKINLNIGDALRITIDIFPDYKPKGIEEEEHE